MIVSTEALLIPLLLSVSLTSAAEFSNNPRCGDCWCIPNDGNTCPTDFVGLTDTFSETDNIYSTFELTNDRDFLKLQSKSGGPCYPFSDTFGNQPLANYPESDEEQCVSPEEIDDVVCAYVYDSSSTTCEGRKYKIQNFPSTNDAIMSNAAILHEGACGVCSTAQDFGARIKTHGTLDTDSIMCATSYTFSRDFPTLISCYENLGFTVPCATLWAHYVATNGSNCALDCFPVDGVTLMNGPAPECAPTKCSTCQEEFRKDFDKIAGIEFPKAGITERIAYSCDDFYRVIHDPCIGLEESDPGDDSSTFSTSVDTSDATPETTIDEETSAGNNIGTMLFAMTVTLALSILEMY